MLTIHRSGSPLGVVPHAISWHWMAPVTIDERGNDLDRVAPEDLATIHGQLGRPAPMQLEQDCTGAKRMISGTVNVQS